MASVKDFLIKGSRVPKKIREIASNYGPPSSIMFGRSKTFGFFILERKNSGQFVRWVQKNKLLAAKFIEQVKSEKPTIQYQKSVNQHKVRDGTDITPRIYLDKGLIDAGFKPGDSITVTINSATKTIVIEADEL